MNKLRFIFDKGRRSAIHTPKFSGTTSNTRFNSRITALAVMLTATVLTACTNGTEEVQSKSLNVEVQTPQKGDLIINSEFIGTLSPTKPVYVIPFVAGEVMETYVNIGDYVEEGELLCKLDDTAAGLQYKSANAAYNSAKAGVNQANGAAADIQDLQTSASVKQLEDQVKSYQDQLNDSNKKLKELKDAKANVDKAQATAYNSYIAAVTKSATAGNMKARGVDQSLAAMGITTQLALETAVLNYINTVSEVQHTSLTDALAGLSEAQKTALSANPQYLLYASLQQANINVADLTEVGYGLLKEDESRKQAAYEMMLNQTGSVNSGITTLESAVKQLTEAVNQTQSGLETARQSQNLASGPATAEKNALLKTQLESAGIGVEAAKVQLDMYKLEAPISGTVEAVNVSVHGFTQTGSPAFVISDKSIMKVTFYVTESVRDALYLGQSVSVEHGGKEYSGKISEIGLMVDMQRGLFAVKTDVNPAGDELLSGVSVKLRLDTRKEMDTFIIPYDAVYYSEGQAYVYCAVDGAAKKVLVKTGLFNDEYISITEGLNINDKVITTWNASLRDGAEISITENAGQ